MAINRSITVLVDSGTDSELTTKLLKRLNTNGDSAGTNTVTFGNVSVGARTDQIKVQVGSGGANTVSASILVDAAITQERWMELIADVFSSCLAADSDCTLTCAAAYAAGGRTDTMTCTIT